MWLNYAFNEYTKFKHYSAVSISIFQHFIASTLCMQSMLPGSRKLVSVCTFSAHKSSELVAVSKVKVARFTGTSIHIRPEESGC